MLKFFSNAKRSLVDILKMGITGEADSQYDNVRVHTDFAYDSHLFSLIIDYEKELSALNPEQAREFIQADTGRSQIELRAVEIAYRNYMEQHNAGTLTFGR